MKNCNANNPTFDAMRQDDVPDVIIVKKVYDRSQRVARRRWKVKRLEIDGNIVGRETDSVADEFQRYAADLFFASNHAWNASVTWRG